MKTFVLQRTVVPAVCKQGKRVLPIVQMISEIAKQVRRGGGR